MDPPTVPKKIRSGRWRPGKFQKFLARPRCGPSCRSSRVRNAPLATVGLKKAACRDDGHSPAGINWRSEYAGYTADRTTVRQKKTWRAMGLARFTTCAPMPVRRSSTPRRALKTYMRGCRSE